MPKKNIQDIMKKVKDARDRMVKGQNYFLDLMTNGVTVIDPNAPKENNKVKFNNVKESSDFLSKLRNKDNTYPLSEICRPGNELYHMYMFLYSKGITPGEIETVIEYPGENKEIEDKIKGLRDDYFKLAMSKDTDAIANMYVEGYKVIQSHDVGWLKHSNTPEKIADKLIKIDVIGGSHSVWIQTNNLGGKMRPVDKEVVTKTTKLTREAGINIKNVIDGMQFMNSIQQSLQRALSPSKNNPQGMTELDFSLQHISLINDDMTIATISQDPKISYEQTFLENNNYDESKFDMFDSGEEYNQAVVDKFLGDKDAFPPKILFESVFGETVDDSLASEAGKWASDAYRIKGHDKEWSEEILESFRGGKLISGYSALHAVNLVKNGTFDSLSGIEGDGNNMLEVMHGDYSKYEQLSDLAKAAVVTRFCADHPDMFIGTTDNMLKAAEKAGMGLDNPIYARALSGYQKHCAPYSAKKLDTVKSIMAEKNLSKTMETMHPGDKKKLLKSLMIMQIGGAVQKDILKDNTNETMMSLLAKGNVDIRMPEMDADQLYQFKMFFPEGNEPVANGLSQEFTFGKDSLKISLNGVRGQAGATADNEADLRKVNPAGLNMLLGAMDYLYDKMQYNEINDLYNKLNDPNLGKEALADIIRGFADPDLIKESPNMEQHLVITADEVDPPLILDQDDFIFADSIYGYEPEGERKYPKLDAKYNYTKEQIDERLSWDTSPESKEFFTKAGNLYLEVKRQVEMYSDAAEKMHRILEENEKTGNPSPNIRNFAEEKEKEFAKKYRQSMEQFNKVITGFSEAMRETKSKYVPKAWLNFDLTDPVYHNMIEDNYDKKDPMTKDSIAESLMSNFNGVGFETAAENTMNKLAGHKWKFMGITFSNSDIYDDIVESMKNLKGMRDKDLNADNNKAYKEEYNHLRDLCAEYIVTHKKNPLSQDGKDRLRMVKSVWEGMSNTDEKALDKALEGAEPGKKIADVNIHKGNRVKVSFDDLMKEEPERKERLKEAKLKKKQASKEKESTEKNKNKGISI
ncbi:MAG: hypothetical protein K6F90_01380 [Lachnospiraceae bacterium]|nr:hypothetical protein [Lachnospiraceae bacterium]